jgi:hypothetical protein
MLAMKSKKLQTMLPVTTVEGRIHLVRGRKVILDRDLAELYGVSTKALNQAVKRNIQRFPDEFVFQVAKEEADSLRSQSVTLNEPDQKWFTVQPGRAANVITLAAAKNE